MVAKTRREIQGMTRANVATARLLKELIRRAEPGVMTGALNLYALDFMRRIGGEPVFHTQNGFPGAINTSVNDEAVHGVPCDRVLKSGDLLKIDCGIGLDGYCGDSTVTMIVGGSAAPDERRAVMETAREALRRGIAAVRVGGHIGDVGHAMDEYVEGTGFHLLRQFTGHGIGRRLWEPPSVPAWGCPGEGPRIAHGLVFTIEPIVAAGGGEVLTGADGWTVRTVDRAPVAQFEHTVVAMRDGVRVLSECFA